MAFPKKMVAKHEKGEKKGSEKKESPAMQRAEKKFGAEKHKVPAFMKGKR